MKRRFVAASYKFAIWTVIYIIFTKYTTSSKVVDDALDPMLVFLITIIGVFIIGIAVVINLGSALPILRRTFIEETLSAISIVLTLWSILFFESALAKFGVNIMQTGVYLSTSFVIILIVLGLFPWLLARLMPDQV